LTERTEKTEKTEKTESKDEAQNAKKAKVHDCFGRECVAHYCGTPDDGANLLGTGRERLKHGNEQVPVAISVPGVSVIGHVGQKKMK